MTSTGSHWRDTCRPIIARVIAKNPSADEKELRRLLSRAYPFGERAHHPYKIWLSEIRFQLGKSKVYGSKKFMGQRKSKNLTWTSLYYCETSQLIHVRAGAF